MRDGAREREFHACYVELYPRVAAYLWSLTRDRDVAHDLAQETFARLFDRWGRIDDPAPYAYRVATNLAKRSWRATRREADALRGLHDGRDAVLDTTGEVDLRSAVDTLPRRYRQVVLLHYYADLPLPVVAGTLDRPLGTVKRQLAEARALLAAALEGAR